MRSISAEKFKISVGKSFKLGENFQQKSQNFRKNISNRIEISTEKNKTFKVEIQKLKFHRTFRKAISKFTQNLVKKSSNLSKSKSELRNQSMKNLNVKS